MRLEQHSGRQEACMIKWVIKFVTLATVLMGLVAAPSLIPAWAAGGGGGPDNKDTSTSSYPPPAPGTRATSTTHRARSKPSKQSAIDDPAFAKSYRAAYDTIYDRNDYAGAIEQLKALGHDDHPNVATSPI
jgi:hypothetical protein